MGEGRWQKGLKGGQAGSRMRDKDPVFVPGLNTVPHPRQPMAQILSNPLGCCCITQGKKKRFQLPWNTAAAASNLSWIQCRHSAHLRHLRPAQMTCASLKSSRDCSQVKETTLVYFKYKLYIVQHKFLL